ncbi:MAG: DUF4304 domain-containing protein [Mycolicibacterium sp.]
MIKREVERARLRRSFEAMLSGAVDAFLSERGFERSGNDFERHRGPLRDRINFQNNWHNGKRASALSARGLLIAAGS